MNGLVYGYGFCDLSTSKLIDGKYVTDPQYRAWAGMIERCYSAKFHLKQPMYSDCSVCTEWLTYSTFKDWYDNNYIDGWQIDKDLLIDGNRVYSPETCVFVPSQLNTLLISNNAKRGLYPQGVSFHKKSGRFRSQCRANGKTVHLGLFDDENDASLTYMRFKYKHVIKEVLIYAEKYEDNKMLMSLLKVLYRRYTLKLNKLN